MMIQSNSRDPLYLNERIESFLAEFYKTLEQLSDENFQHNRQAIIDNLLEKPKNISAVSYFYFILLLQYYDKLLYYF